MMAEQPNRELNRPNDNSLSSNTSRSDRISQNPNDDVIASLAMMPENRRAQQVGEWETMRRRTFKHLL